MTKQDLVFLMVIVYQYELKHSREIEGLGIMFSFSILGSKIIIIFIADDGFKINAENYCKLLNKVFE